MSPHLAPMIALPLALAACHGDLQVTPSALTWGDVNFNAERPPDGYDARSVAITNTGRGRLDVVIYQFDADHLFLAAPFLSRTDPPTLDRLPHGETQTVSIAPWDYALGELTTEVSGTLLFDAPGLRDPVSVPWSFTPTRSAGEDTGG